ncbi:MAG: hypothetical protein ACOY42_00635 [Pseudomonadota bacterium]
MDPLSGLWWTLGLAVAVLAAVLAVLLRVRTPYFRFDRGQMIRVLNLVLDGQALAQDWTLLMVAPLRHDAELARLRRRCREIAAAELIDTEAVRFSAAGRRQLEQVLSELEAMQEDGR